MKILRFCQRNSRQRDVDARGAADDVVVGHEPAVAVHDHTGAEAVGAGARGAEELPEHFLEWVARRPLDQLLGADIDDGRQRRLHREHHRVAGRFLRADRQRDQHGQQK